MNRFVSLVTSVCVLVVVFWLAGFLLADSASRFALVGAGGDLVDLVNPASGGVGLGGGRLVIAWSGRSM